MQAKAQVYGTLIRQCRMLRMSVDVDVARAALDVEQDLVVSMREKGMELPDLSGAVPARPRRPRRVATPEPVEVAGGAR